MISSRIVIAGFIAASTASYLPDEHLFATLLKRQEPGTPEYNCHDNCGTAITISKAGGDYCSDEVFLYDYNNCLQCAGPDNDDIWKYYGRSLSGAAEKCSGFETEPKSGEQEDVGEAKHPGESSDASSAAPVSSSSPATTAEVSISSAATSAVSSVVSSPGETSAAATATPVAPVPTVPNSPSATGNGTDGTAPTATASATLAVPFEGAGSTQTQNMIGMIGAMLLGVFFF